MAFKGIFVGVNRHQDTNISELTGAVRDAQALYALFCDTFSDLDGCLLTDQTASLASIKEHLDEALTRSTPEDVVVVFFAGHGTPEHQLVPYDTDCSNFTASTLAMQELADKFRESSARAILCIIDCCFSGAAPARVIESAPRSRGGFFSYESFEGKGRFLLAAASPTEPAWEEPGTGHGLLTKAIIEVFTSGTDSVDITAAVAEIVSKTKAYAQHIGEQQNPSFVGSVEGKLELPALRRGERWYEFFPELHKITVGRAIDELSAFNLPDEVLKAWEGRYRDGLNALQIEAVNIFRVLDGDSLLVIAPTSSGKTFIGEMCAIRAAVENRKAVFLLPYRALVNEKYDDFLDTYSPLGLRVVRCSGDFSDDVSLFLSGRYDIALLTFEMFLTLSVASPHILKRLGLVVVDEAQFITDPARGISIELLLTLLCAGRQRELRPQLIALSAVIGGINGFDEWLGAKHLFWKERPVPLTEGVLDRSGIYQCIDTSGNEREVQLIPRHEIQQRRGEPSAQDVIVPLVRSLVSAKEKVLIFRNTRGPAEGCAAYLAKELRLPEATKALTALPSHDPTGSGQKLRECLLGGTAFHNSNLKRDERVVVERHFRDPGGGIEVLAATTTLAAGINTPASTVILAEQEFVGEDGRPFTVAEYKNMAGRAGRLGYNENGKSVILAETPFQRRELFARYVRGVPEPIRSSFEDHDFRTWVIRLLSQVKTIKETDVPHLLASTYGGFLAGRTDENWVVKTEDQIRRIVESFIVLGLLERRENNVQLTLLGRACGQSTLSFESSMRLIEVIKSGISHSVSAFTLVAILQVLPEADALYTPIRKKVRIESVRIGEAVGRFGSDVAYALQLSAPDEITYWARCKRAVILADWMAGIPIQEVERRYTVPFGGQVQSGDIQRFSEATRFHLRSAHQILAALLAMSPEQEAEFDSVMKQLEFGVPANLTPMMDAPLLLSRGEVLALAGIGLQRIDELRKQENSFIAQILGDERTKHVQKALKKLA